VILIIEEGQEAVIRVANDIFLVNAATLKHDSQLFEFFECTYSFTVVADCQLTSWPTVNITAPLQNSIED